MKSTKHLWMLPESIVNMPLILTIGPPGCGKTTWVNETFGPNWLKLERDKLRSALFGTKKAYYDSPFTGKERLKVITQCGRQAIRAWPNSKVVCSDTNLFWFTAQHFAREFAMNDIKLVLFEVDKEACLRQNLQRAEDDVVPEKEWRPYWDEYVSPHAWWRSPEWSAKLFSVYNLEI